MDNDDDRKSDVAIKKKVENFQFSFLEPNNFVCTTAVKAYGRKMDVNKALAVLPWMENKGLEADTYLLSSLLFVCAKTKRVAEAESIFWHKIPARNLTYSVATTNSLMYMYAKLNRPDDALKVYELAKGVCVCVYLCMHMYVRMLFLVFIFFYMHSECPENSTDCISLSFVCPLISVCVSFSSILFSFPGMGLKCTVVTYGVLIKALMRSGKKQVRPFCPIFCPIFPNDFYFIVKK